MWHVQITNQGIVIIRFPARSEDVCYLLLNVLRENYPELNIGLYECSGPQVCEACP